MVTTGEKQSILIEKKDSKDKKERERERCTTTRTRKIR